MAHVFDPMKPMPGHTVQAPRIFEMWKRPIRGMRNETMLYRIEM
jgi:hypothetical protein